jgi:Domain of unknown function (DU1801)
MAEAKTKATRLSVLKYLDGIADDARRADCEAIAALMKSITKKEPAMWGASIVGYGKYAYVYDSGRSGEFCATGFSSRKGDISIYLVASGPNQDELLGRLGKHKMGKSCLTIKRLADVDRKVLRQLIAESYRAIMQRYPAKP